MSEAIGPKIQPQHLTGGIGEAIVRQTFLGAGVPVISVDQGDDYGTDMLAQVPHRGTNQLSGSLVRIQVKCGKERYHKRDGTGRCVLDDAHYAYYTNGPIPSVLITVDPDTMTMHWGNITQQLRRDRGLRTVYAPNPFTKTAVPEIVQIAKQAAPGDWVISLADANSIARHIAIEGCLLTAHQDHRVLDALRAYSTRMSMSDISFLANRIHEEALKHSGQQSLMDFGPNWGSSLEEMLPAERSYQKRPPYPRTLFNHLIDLFEFSSNDILEIIDRNEGAFHDDLLLTDNSLLQGASSILDWHPTSHADALMRICISGLREMANSGIIDDAPHTFPVFMKALELDPDQVQHFCAQERFRVTDIIWVCLRQDPETAAVMWSLWND
ncbi:DUF4365 domain-containing protein [Streptomyces sp. TR06-5]|uniref:DUF4365 domain-containing protein n=1 Tax=Streptomyces sp. TR06-5 TaxID=3385976 RepID=UPI0039A059E3